MAPRIPHSALAFVLAGAFPALADVLPPNVTAVLPEAFASDGAALERAGVRVSVWPEPLRWGRKDGLAGLPAGYGVVVRPGWDGTALASLKARALRGRCRVVVRAEAGLSYEQAMQLGAVGPCFFEVHVASDPEPFAAPFARLRPASVVWEAGGSVPSTSELARLAGMPLPVVAVDEAALPAALERVDALGENKVSLRVTGPSGRLSKATLRLLRDAPRRARVTIVAVGGLDPLAARAIRALPRVDVELSLDQGVPPGLVEAAEALLRPVDPLDRRMVDEEEADAPLLQLLPAAEPPAPKLPVPVPSKRPRRP